MPLPTLVVFGDASCGPCDALLPEIAAWERDHGGTKLELVELETGAVVREATAEEAAASKRKEPEDGVGAIDFGDGKLYYVRAG